MLLTITTTHPPATDLGYLLYKNPGRVQEFELAFGRARVFYPEASVGKCTCALLLDVDPVGSVRGREFSLGVEGLERFVRGEPLRRVHECVFGVLALESEPVDPRL